MTHISAAFETNHRWLATKDPAIAVGVKHGNACGAAVTLTPRTALEQMLVGNPVSLFGGLVMVNCSIDDALAEILVGIGPNRRLLDGVIAPRFSPAAAEILARKKGKCRLLANPHLEQLALDRAPRFRYVRGGWLRQPNYTQVVDLDDPDLRWYGEVRHEQRAAMLLAWAVGATSNSNTITLVKKTLGIECQLTGNGVGQQDRVEAAKLAVRRAREAGHDTRGAVAYSDSFFPFDDGPKVLIEAGIKAVLTTSGSINDETVIKTFRDAGVSVVMIPDKLGRGFFGH